MRMEQNLGPRIEQKWAVLAGSAGRVSLWKDWAVWSANSSGPLQDPSPMDSKKYPVIEQGPGGYVKT